MVFVYAKPDSRHTVSKCGHDGLYFMRWRASAARQSQSQRLCTENHIRIDDVIESPKLAE
jgi:hypothetical protein